MEPESKIPHSQGPAFCPYSEPDKYIPCPPFHIFENPFFIIFPSMSRSLKWSLSHRSPHQNPACTSHVPHKTSCPAHLFRLDLITRKILGEKYKSLSSASCSLLHSPVTSNLLVHYMPGIPERVRQPVKRHKVCHVVAETQNFEYLIMSHVLKKLIWKDRVSTFKETLPCGLIDTF